MDDQAVVLTTFDKFAKTMKDYLELALKRPLLNWSRRNSLFPMHMGLMCCALEMASVMGPRWDTERIGLMPRASPRQCDLIWINGPVTKKMAPRIKRLYDQMPRPSWAIATGECAISGGPWWESYSVVRGADQVIPIDVYVPGCPPRPEAMWMGIEVLKRVITHEKKHGVKPSSGKPIVASDITMKNRWFESMDGFYPWLEKKK
jgi:NADH-quinone oxidoreductase subunit B